MSNSLDPDQARRVVGPDLGPNCLPRLSAEDIGRQRVKRYCRFGNVRENLIFANIGEFVASRIQSSRYY